MNGAGTALFHKGSFVRHGHRLGPIVHAINYSYCDRIREFHPKLYDRPPKDAPIIEAIRITAASDQPGK
jgi:hypothetical protein